MGRSCSRRASAGYGARFDRDDRRCAAPHSHRSSAGMGSAMKIVALETATVNGSVALLDGPRVVEKDADLRGDGAVFALEQLLAAQRIAPKDIAAVAVSIGPGSFTGVRIGAAAAQGFAMGAGCQVV